MNTPTNNPRNTPQNTPQNTPTTAKPQVWFITGTSTGIGRVLAEQAAAAGHRVVCTARQKDSLQPLRDQYPDHIHPVSLDVNDPDQITEAVRQAETAFGRVDVLVNNAGYGLEGALEELTMEEVRRQMETNFLGLVDLTRQLLPGMRQRQHGYIFNVASVAGFRGFRGMSLYCASKFAVVGLSESLAPELLPYGIKVCIIEPGPYRTDWAGRSLHKSRAIREDDPNSPYRELNLLLEENVTGNSGKQPGDPAQIAEVLLSAVEHDHIPMHLIFGDEAIAYWQARKDKLNDPTYVEAYPHTRRSVRD